MVGSTTGLTVIGLILVSMMQEIITENAIANYVSVLLLTLFQVFD